MSCQCGYISFRTPGPTPLGMAHCHCTDCQKQSSSAFGTSAYFPSNKVFPLPAELEEKFSSFTQTADSGNTKYCYFCPKCGVRILHLSYYPGGKIREIVSFKGGAVSGLDWTGVKHIFTRSAVMKIPDEWEQYETVPPSMINKVTKKD